MYVPLILWIPYRIGKAFLSTFRLLFDFRLMRALPWRYIARLPLRNVWIAIAAVGLAAGVVGIVVASALWGRPRELVWGSSITLVWLALISSWVRAIVQWRRLRHG
jgi:hypothetical protein